MTLNTSDKEAIAARRERVARLRLKGATQREIVKALACSLGTVNSDLAALRQEWRDAAAADTAEHQAAVLAELREVRRAAWAQPGIKGLPFVLQSLKQECALLGLDAPQAIDVQGDGLAAQQQLIAVVLQLLAPYPEIKLLLAEQLDQVIDANDADPAANGA